MLGKEGRNQGGCAPNEISTNPTPQLRSQLGRREGAWGEGELIGVSFSPPGPIDSVEPDPPSGHVTQCPLASGQSQVYVLPSTGEVGAGHLLIGGCQINVFYRYVLKFRGFFCSIIPLYE